MTLKSNFTRLLCLPAMALLAMLAGQAWAQTTSIVGQWTTIDDKTSKPRSIIRIVEENGSFEAIIDKIFPQPGEDPDPKCDKCKDHRKDQRVIGMKIMTGLKRTGTAFDGGQILDPDDGNIYRVKMKLSDDGKKLEVRGYIGISLFGRSQTWVRDLS